MRVTNNSMANVVLNNIGRNYSRMLDLQNTISTGKKINAPSDDPIGAGNIMAFRGKISDIDQYTRNIEWGNYWLRSSESALDAVDNQLVRAKELAVYQASGTASDHTREIAAAEVDMLFDQMVQLANSSVDGRYLFSGQKTDTAPYAADSDGNVSFAGNTGDIRLVVGEGIDMAVNTNGEDVFNDSVNVFDVLTALKEGLENNDTEAISAQIEQLDLAMKQVLNERAQIGGRLNRLEATGNHWDTVRLSTQNQLIDTEDADLVTTLTDLKSMEIAYQAALTATASVIQPSLMDFLS